MKSSWRRIGTVLLLGVAVVAGVLIINRRNGGGLASTPQVLDARMDALMSALSRLESESTSKEHDGAFFAACHAIYQIGELRSEAAPAVPLLVGVLSGPERQDSLRDASLRSRAAFALEEIGRPAIGPVVGLLSHNDAQVRWLAAQALCGWATGKTMRPADIPLSDLQIAVPPIKEALSRETVNWRNTGPTLT